MRALNCRSLLLVSFFAAAAAAQQPPTEAVSNDIIVEGNRNQEKRIAEFVNALTKATPRGQLSRLNRKSFPDGRRRSELSERSVGPPIAPSCRCGWNSGRGFCCLPAKRLGYRHP